jgi:hypothetical protein
MNKEFKQTKLAGLTGKHIVEYINKNESNVSLKP